MAARLTLTSLDPPGGPFPSADPPPPGSSDAPPPPGGPRGRARASLVREAGYGTVLDLGTIIGGSGLDLFGGDRNNDPVLYGRYGGYWPADRVQLPTKGPVGFFTEVQLRAAVAWSRWLCQRNMLAIGFRDRMVEFVGPAAVEFVRDGQSPGAAGGGPANADGSDPAAADPLVAAVQQVWDEWCAAARWGQGLEDREKEQRERLVEDGEVFLRLGPGGQSDRFLPWVRQVEPEQVRPPAGPVELPPDIDPADVSWRWGVATSHADAEHVYGYWVADIDSGGAHGEFVPACEVVHLKHNCKGTERRGVPDLLPVEHHLQDVVGIVGNMGGTAREQSGVAWRERHATASEDMVRTLVRQGPEAYRGHDRRGEGEGVGSAIRRFRTSTVNGVRVVHADAGREWEDGPTAAGAESFKTVIDATLKAVGFRFGVPDWFAGGSADSFASALVTGSPLALAIEGRQDRMRGLAVEVARRVIRLAEGSGRLPAGASAAVKPVATARPVVIADEEKQARTAISLYEKNLADPHEIIKGRGDDPKRVAAGIQAWNRLFPPAGPAAPPGVAPPPKDPTPAPPGSAGGDGSSPNDPLAAEGYLLLDAALSALVREAAGLVEREVTVHRGGRTFTRTQLVRPGDAGPPARAGGGGGAGADAGGLVSRAVARLKAVGSAALNTRAGRFLTRVEHALSILAHKTREVAAAAAARRRPPLGEERIARLTRLLAVADFVGSFVAGGIVAATVHPIAGKVTSTALPSVSVLYVAYSAARDPAGTWAAARQVVADTLKGRSVHESADGISDGLADRLAALVAGDDADWREAVFLAALAEVAGDRPAAVVIEHAVEVAESAPPQPATLPTPTPADFGEPAGVQEHAHGSNLVQRLIRDKNGVERHVWVNPADAEHVGDGPARAGEMPAARLDRPKYPGHPAARAVEDTLAHAEHLTPETRQGYHHAAAQVLGRIPATGLDRIGRHQSGPPRFYPDTKSLGLGVTAAALKTEGVADEVMTRLRALRRKIEEGWTSIGGAVHWNGEKGGQLHLDGGYAPAATKPGGHGNHAESAHEVYAHEFTHLIDGPEGQISGSARWSAIWAAEIGPKVTGDDGQPRLTSYAQTNKAEGLAEFGRLVYGGAVSLDRVEREFPQATKLFKDARLWPGS